MKITNIRQIRNFGLTCSLFGAFAACAANSGSETSDLEAIQGQSKINCTQDKNSDRVVGSGDLVDVEFVFDGINAIDVDECAFTLDVQQGGDADAIAVVLTSDDNIVDQVEIIQDGETLQIGLVDDANIETDTLDVTIVMPALAQLDLAFASRATVAGFDSADEFTANLAQASILDADIVTGDINLTLDGACNAVMRGAGADLVLDANASSNADLSEFVVNNAEVNLNLVSAATVNVAGVLDATVEGISQLTVLGNPELGDVEIDFLSNVEVID